MLDRSMLDISLVVGRCLAGERLDPNPPLFIFPRERDACRAQTSRGLRMCFVLPAVALRSDTGAA
jgi:hypothetical protein